MKKIAITAILLFVILILSIYPHFIIIIQTKKNLTREFLFPGEGFIFKYKHSVARTPVTEEYRLTWSGRLKMVETTFQSYGAGLPLETRNFTEKDGKFIISDMDVSLPEVRIRVSRTPGQTITINNHTLFLQEMAEPGQLVIIKTEPLYRAFAN